MYIFVLIVLLISMNTPYTMKKAILIIFLFLFSSIFSIVAQPISEVKEFSAKDGLVQGVVTGIIQDSKGVLWFSTWNGINKFDGYTFKNFKVSYQKEYGQSNNRINSMCEMLDGNILCLAYDGKPYVFNSQEKLFYNVLEDIESDIQKKIVVNQIYHFDGISWLVADDGNCFRMQDQWYKNKDSIVLYNTFNDLLKGDEILKIYQDTAKDEWILTNKGITILGKKEINTNQSFKYIHEHQGEIYLVTTTNKLAVYDDQTENINFIDIPYTIHAISAISSLSNHLLVLATDNGVIFYDTEKEEMNRVDIRTATQKSNNALSIYEDKEGDLWTFTPEPGVMRINVKTREKQHLFTPKNEVVSYERESVNLIFEDKQGTLWVLPEKGNFSYFDRETKELKPYYLDRNNPESAFTPLVRNSFIDKQGSLWLVGARGVKRMTFHPKTYNLRQLDDEGIEVRAIFRDQSGQLWVASKSGFIRIYNPNGSLKGYLNPQGEISKREVSFDAKGYCFHQDSEGTIWMGAKTKGLYQLKKKDENSYSIDVFTHNEADEYSLSSNDIYTIFEDSNQNVWLGCYGGGINLMQKEENGKVKFYHFHNDLSNYPAVGFQNVRIITEVDNGILLIGTTNGIISFSNTFKQPGEIVFYQNRHCAEDGMNLVGKDVMDIFTDSKGNTYVLTFTGGINKIKSTDLLTHCISYQSYTTRNILVSDLVLSMIEDETKQLWVIYENGLSKFDAQNETLDNYDRVFLKYDFSFTEALPTFNANNELILGTDRGFLEIVPDKLKKSEYVPPIIFTDLKVNGKVSSSPIDDLNELILSPSQRNVTINFSALDYVRPEEIQYAYKLTGLESQWNRSETNRSANYLKLPVGEYVLEVKSTNSDGVWVDNVRTLPIKVLPTFWETGWAWLIYILIFVLFTGAVVYILFYIYRLRHEVTVEQQISDIKLRFFTDISHELRTPLTLISTPITEVLEKEPLSPTARKHLNLVYNNTERMLRLINQILDFRKIQNRKMKVLMEKVELVTFIQKVSGSFDLIANKKEIDYQFNSEVEELCIWIDKDKVEKILFNLLSNAFKYTLPGKSIEISLKVSDDKVSLFVRDEGIGISPKILETLFNRFETNTDYNIMQPSSGIGLSLVKELVELLNGTIEVKSQLGKGSEFCVQFPLEQKALEDESRVEFILNDSPDKSSTSSSTVTAESRDRGRECITTEAEDKPSILIVEDNEELKDLLKTILKSDYEILEASDGEEGLQSVLADLPDMVITDVMMPVMDGIEMIKQIKANKDICHIPVIILSAKSSLDDRIEGLEYGVDDYITKPFSSSYLKAKVSSLFNQRKQLQELFMNELSDKKAEEPNLLEPSKPDIMPYDELFINEVMAFMEEHMGNSELVVDDFADKLSMSRSLFYRKLKTITGLSPIDFIREIRFKRAAQLIENGSYNFSEIAYMTGFNDPKYFSKSFKKHMGVTPSEYKENCEKKKE